MFISTEPRKLSDAIRHAEEVRDVHMESVADTTQSFVGSAYRGSMGKAMSEPFVFEYLSLVVPKTIYDNPRYEIKARRQGTRGEQARLVATALAAGINQWTRDVNLRAVLTELAYDFFQLWCCGLVRQRPMPGYDPSKQKNIHRPEVSRIPQEWFFFDPMCMAFRNAAYVGHKWAADRDELLAEAKRDRSWNAKLLASIKTSPDDLHPDEGLRRGAPDRNAVLLSEVWVPGATDDVPDHPGPEEGYHGTVYTMDVSGDRTHDEWVRKPYAYYGPACGPYFFGGIYHVRNSPFPLAPLVATKDQQAALDANAEAVNKSAENYKRGVIVDDKAGGLSQKIRDFRHDTVLPIPGFDPAMVRDIEVGGVTDQQLTQLGMARERLERASAMSDARRGNVTGAGTATENAIADEAMATRESLPKAQFADVARQVGYIAAYHMFHDDRVVFELDDDTLAQMEMQRSPATPESPDNRIMYYGGQDEEDEDFTFDGLDLSVDIMSMERTNTAMLQRNMTTMFSTLVDAAGVMTQAPWMEWDRLLDDLGDVYNMPNLGEYVDMDMLRQMGVPVTDAGPTPILAGDAQGGPGTRPMGQTPMRRPMMQQAQSMGAVQGAGRRSA